MPFDLSRVNQPSPEIREDHYFFERDGRMLFRADYCPAGKAKAGVVLCAPFAEEKVRTLRIYVSLARGLAAQGAAAVVFDYFGDGDSEGDFEEASLNDRFDDIRAVYRDLQAKTDTSLMALHGLRWGATLAGRAAEELKPNALVLWEPIVDTQRYFKDHLRSHLASQMLTEGKVIRNREQLIADLEAGETLSVEGYGITGQFFREASAAGLSEGTIDYDGPALLVPITRNQSRIKPEIRELSERLRHCTLQPAPKEFEWEKTDTWQPAPPKLFSVTFDFLTKHGLL